MNKFTSAVGGVDGLVSLDEDIARLKGDHDNLLKQSVRELSLQIHILLNAGILTEVSSRDLNHYEETQTVQ